MHTVILTSVFKIYQTKKENMKLSAFLPIVYSNPVQDFLTETVGLNELKSGHSLCESDECPKLDGIPGHINEKSDNIETASCSKEYKNSFLSGRMDRCEYYNADHSDCVEWALKELESACGGSYNCIETEWSYISGWGHYWGYSSK